jgi:hypothetical protein
MNGTQLNIQNEMVVNSIRFKIVRNTTEILYRGSKQSGRDL